MRECFFHFFSLDRERERERLLCLLLREEDLCEEDLRRVLEEGDEEEGAATSMAEGATAATS